LWSIWMKKVSKTTKIIIVIIFIILFTATLVYGAC